MVIIVWLLYVIFMVAIIYKNVKEARAIKTRRQVIDNACEWLYEQMGSEKFVARFRKALED